MARKKQTSSLTKLLLIVISVVLGLCAGFVGFTYVTLPSTDELVISTDVFYSYNNEKDISNIQLTNQPGEVSVHFLELGNKYTGDCTYIKVGDVDILIDCGSKSNSVATVSNYLNNYVKDGILEYVIITHAHTDHYAGFATSEKVDSIFDLYECKNIIYFSQTNQKPTNATYKNFLRELNDEVEAGANAYTALDCINETNGAKRIYTLNEEYNITLEILNSYYYANKQTSGENNHSVCTMINQGEGENAKHFLFTGDLEKEGETKLIELNSLPEVDLYKAGHHGSKTSSNADFLEVIQPKTVCVCCCAGSPEYTKTKDNQFPTQDFINRIAVYTDKIFVTTLCVNWEENEFTSFNGNIVVISNTEDFGINCSNNNIILKDTEWFTNNRVWPTLS